MQSSDQPFVPQAIGEPIQGRTPAKSPKGMLRIATTAIIALSMAGCGTAEGGSSPMDLVVTEDTKAVNHWTAPAGRMEIPMEIGAGTIVRGNQRDVGNSGTCTVHWTDMEKREALGGGEEEVREQFLDLPCASLAEATDADRSKRVPYDRTVPAVHGPSNKHRGENRYLEALSTAERVPGSDGKVSLSSPVWACKSKTDYQDKLGYADAPCVVLHGNSVLDMVDPHGDTESDFYRVRISMHGSNETYVVNKGDALFVPYFASTGEDHRKCLTTPQAECFGGYTGRSNKKIQSTSQSEEKTESYLAYISANDLHNSRGSRLAQPWQIIRQDRANFHKFKLRDQRDEGDRFFSSMTNRDSIERMFRVGSISPEAARDIVQGNVLVLVEIRGKGGVRDTIHVTTTQ